jgi:hypothetical protein
MKCLVESQSNMELIRNRCTRYYRLRVLTQFVPHELMKLGALISNKISINVFFSYGELHASFHASFFAL